MGISWETVGELDFGHLGRTHEDLMGLCGDIIQYIPSIGMYLPDYF